MIGWVVLFILVSILTARCSSRAPGLITIVALLPWALVDPQRRLRDPRRREGQRRRQLPLPVRAPLHQVSASNLAWAGPSGPAHVFNGRMTDQTPPPPPVDGNPYASSTPQPMSPADEKLWSILIHIGGIVFGFLAPLIGYLVLKDRGPFVREHTATALNFQLTMLIALRDRRGHLPAAHRHLHPDRRLGAHDRVRHHRGRRREPGRYYTYPLSIKFVSCRRHGASADRFSDQVTRADAAHRDVPASRHRLRSGASPARPPPLTTTGEPAQVPARRLDRAAQSRRRPHSRVRVRPRAQRR